MTPEHQRLSQRLGYTFHNKALLTEALSHRSAGAKNYERLEFLGDSALNFVIATELYHLHSKLDEGSLSRLRSSLVKGVTLAKIARELELGQYLNLGSGELKSGGFERDSILADAVESVIGAVYIDGGFAACKELILRLFAERLNNLPPVGELKDPKTRLQEFLQSKGMPLPVYELVKATGKSHNQCFTVSCEVKGHKLKVLAQGSSRRKAEQAAAQEILTQMLGLKG